MSLIYVSSQQLIKKRLHSNRRDANPVSSELWLCDVHRITSCWRHFQFRRKSFFRAVDKILSRFKKIVRSHDKKSSEIYFIPGNFAASFRIFRWTVLLKNITVTISPWFRCAWYSKPRLVHISYICTRDSNSNIPFTLIKCSN